MGWCCQADKFIELTVCDTTISWLCCFCQKWGLMEERMGDPAGRLNRWACWKWDSHLMCQDQGSFLLHHTYHTPFPRSHMRSHMFAGFQPIQEHVCRHVFTWMKFLLSLNCAHHMSLHDTTNSRSNEQVQVLHIRLQTIQKAFKLQENNLEQLLSLSIKKS